MRKLLKRFENIERILIIILLIIIPLYPKFPIFGVPGTYVAIRIEDLIIAIIFLYLIISHFNKYNILLNISMTKAFSIYIAVGLLSLTSAVLITNTVQPLLGTLHLLRRVQYITPFFLGYLAIKNKTIEKEFILKTLVLVISLVLIYGLGQKFLNWPIIVTQNREYAKGIALRSIPGGHINSTFAGHYDLASYMILIIPIFIAYFGRTFDFRKKIIQNIVVFSTIIFGTWLIGISGSRVSTVSFMGAGMLSLILIKKFKLIPLFLAITIIIFSFSSSLISRYQRLIEVGGERINSIREELISEVKSGHFVYAQDESSDFPEKRKKAKPTPTPVPILEDRSTSIRVNVEWPRAIRAFKKNPLLGTGFSSITLATDNDYLRLVGELGILGVMSFISIFLVIGQKLIQGLKSLKKFNDIEMAFIVGVTSALFGIFLNAVFIDIFEASKFAITFWLIIGVTMGIIHSKIGNKEAVKEEKAL
jgi:hypothetical protein